MKAAPLFLLGALPSALVSMRDGDGAEGFATIAEKDLEIHLHEIASPHLEGRDSPSEGLSRAAAYIERCFREAGLAGAGKEGSFRMSYTRDLVAPDPPSCQLELVREGAEPVRFELEKDFVPLPSCPGRARGSAVFAGFGITGAKEHYDDLKGIELKGAVALILEGEPRHKRLFEGPEVTEAADVYAKVAALAKEGAVGVLVVRRAPAEEILGADGAPLAPTEIGYRYNWAYWNPAFANPVLPPERELELPVLEITEDAASQILGESVSELAAKIDQGGKPIRKELADVVLSVSAGFRRESVWHDNVVGIVRGSDGSLAQESIVIGAHYDHIGVDPWGRIGCGADDNGSGTAALIELAQAFGAAPARRSIVFAAFSAEELGLIGSRFFVDEPPVPLSSMVAMINMDMIGQGDPGEAVVLGIGQNPSLEGLLKRANKLRPTGIKKIITGKAEEFWERSDQISFHAKGVPALFFFDMVSEAENHDYHTFRDTIDRLHVDKIEHITRLVFNTTWLIAEDDERPPPPR